MPKNNAKKIKNSICHISSRMMNERENAVIGFVKKITGTAFESCSRYLE